MTDTSTKTTIHLTSIYEYDPLTKAHIGTMNTVLPQDYILEDNCTMTKPPEYDCDFEQLQYEEKTDMWKIIRLDTPLKDFKSMMEYTIDSEITTVIRKNISASVQKSGIYQLKYDESVRYINKNSPKTLTNYPFLKVESKARNMTAEECANIIISKYEEWTKKLIEIETIRQNAKAKIRAVEINSAAKTKIEKIAKIASEKIYNL